MYAKQQRNATQSDENDDFSPIVLVKGQSQWKKIHSTHIGLFILLFIHNFVSRVLFLFVFHFEIICTHTHLYLYIWSWICCCCFVFRVLLWLWLWLLLLLDFEACTSTTFSIRSTSPVWLVFLRYCSPTRWDQKQIEHLNEHLRKVVLNVTASKKSHQCRNIQLLWFELYWK